MGNQTLNNLRRLNQIAVTLIRYGFGGLVGQLHIIPFFPAIERLLVSGKKAKGRSVPERIRLVLEELGPTFVKLGQIASTRADLLPQDWVEEFKKLQDMVPPVPFAEIKAVAEASLKAPLSARFRSFEEVPVASASIAQVHFAELIDGTKVAVKVRRPGIERVILSDMSVMYTVASLLERYVAAARRYRPLSVVAEYERIISNEQDLTIEGAHLSRFADIFKNDPLVQIPKVHWDSTSEGVLTMERISGTPIDESGVLRAKGIDIQAVAKKGIELFFKQVFEHGIFHADLHPGNIFVRDDGAIIYLDFGIVGKLDRDLRRYLASMLFHLVRGDYRAMAVVHRDMGLIGEDVNLSEFEEALRDISEPMFGRTLEQISISALLMKLIHTARKFNMVLQPNLLLLQKSMVIIEGVGRQLYPDINMWEVARPLVYRWMIKEKLSPKKAIEKGRERTDEVLTALLDLPARMDGFFKKALREELKIGFVHHRLEPLTDEVNLAGRRVGGGLVVASLVIASTLAALFSNDGALRVLGLPALSVVGFGISAVLGYVFLSGRKG